MLLHNTNLTAQKMYSLGGASILQTINIGDYKVVDYATLIPSMSDIAFHPDGTLYGVNENSIYKIDSTDGSSVVIKAIPVAYGWLVGMTIDHNGIFYMSGLGGDMDFIISYDPSSDKVVNLGSTGWRHWDLEFFDGELYLSGGTENTSEGFLIQADLSDPLKSKVIMDFGVQAYGMTSFNDACGSNVLVAATSKDIIRLDPDGASYAKTSMNDPLYTFSSGATSRTSYLGSLPPLKVNGIEFGEPLCDSAQTATVEILIGPGRNGVEYSLDGINYQAASSFTNVPVGVHQAFIRDALGCTDMSDPFEIKASSLEFTTQSQPAHCGESNGVIIPMATSVGDSLEFSIDGTAFISDIEFNNLTNGIYMIYVRSKSGCLDSIAVEVEEVPILTHQSTSTPEHCNQEDGTIQVLATGGMEPYSYTIVALPPQPAPIFTGLHASSFLVRVQDVLGCISEDLIDVAMAPVPVVVDVIIQEAHCGMPDGSAEIIALPASGDLEYAINSGPYSPSPLIADLEPGIYTLHLMDAYGCETTSSFVIPAIDGPEIQIIAVESDYCDSAAGTIEIEATASSGSLIYSIDNGPFTSTSVFTGLTTGDYLITVRDSFGCDALENVFVDEESGPEIESIEIVDATCNESNGVIWVIQNNSVDVTYSLNNIDFQESSEFTNLPPGDYVIYIIDKNGCSDSEMASVTNIKQAIINDIVTTDVSCVGMDGMLTIIPDAANNNLQYSIDGTNFLVNPLFEGLEENNYTGYLIDENGCIDSMPISIHGKEEITLNQIITTQSSCGNSDGSITIQTEGAVEVLLNNEDASPTNMITDLEQGSYLITLTNESQCTMDTLVEITGANCNIYIPNTFSPNGDGINETLSPFFDPAQFELLQFQVFDRWGNNVFNCQTLCEWDGMYSGEPSPAGVYVYAMQIKGARGDISDIKGDVTLLR